MATEEENRMGVGRESVTDGSSEWEWVVDVRKMLADNNPRSKRMEEKRWEAQSVYLVPEWLKGTNTNLLPMEEHKRRALVLLIKRSNKPLQNFISAVNDVAGELEAAYGKDLPVKWQNDRPSFVDVMLTDGCFLLEMMSRPFWDYELHDPVFGSHGRQYYYI